MSVTVDTNVLVYASNRADPWHASARSVLGHLATGPAIVYLFWPVLLGYLRLVTHPAILPRPLGPEKAIRNVSRLIELPHVRTAGEGESFWTTFVSTAPPHVRGNDVPDAHLAALMRQQGVRIIYTLDRGFRRYEDIEVRELPATATT